MSDSSNKDSQTSDPTKVVLPVNPNPVTPFSPSVTPTPTASPSKSLKVNPSLPAPLKPLISPRVTGIITNIKGDEVTIVSDFDLKVILLRHGMDSQQAVHALAEIKSLIQK